MMSTDVGVVCKYTFGFLILEEDLFYHSTTIYTSFTGIYALTDFVMSYVLYASDVCDVL